MALGVPTRSPFEEYRVAAAGTRRAGIETHARTEGRPGDPRPDAARHQRLRGVRAAPAVVADGAHPHPLRAQPGQRQDPQARRRADDYVTKPFSVGELVARVRAIFRRAERTARPRPRANRPRRREPRRPQPSPPTAARSGARPTRSRFARPADRSGRARPSARDPRPRVGQAINNRGGQLHREAPAQGGARPDKPQHILTVYGHGYKKLVLCPLLPQPGTPPSARRADPSRRAAREAPGEAHRHRLRVARDLPRAAAPPTSAPS